MPKGKENRIKIRKKSGISLSTETGPRASIGQKQTCEVAKMYQETDFGTAYRRMIESLRQSPEEAERQFSAILYRLRRQEDPRRSALEHRERAVN